MPRRQTEIWCARAGACLRVYARACACLRVHASQAHMCRNREGGVGGGEVVVVGGGDTCARRFSPSPYHLDTTADVRIQSESTDVRVN